MTPNYKINFLILWDDLSLEKIKNKFKHFIWQYNLKILTKLEKKNLNKIKKTFKQ